MLEPTPSERELTQNTVSLKTTQVFAKILKGNTITVEVENLDDFDAVEAKILEKEGIPMARGRVKLLHVASSWTPGTLWSLSVCLTTAPSS